MKARNKAGLAALTLLSTLALAGCDQNAASNGISPEMQTLADKIAIEDLLVDYYTHFGGSDNENFAKYYTQDAVFDVNGIVSTGHEEIVGLYNTSDEDPDNEAGEAASDGGQFNMLLSNIQVDVDGDNATVRLLWTGVMNDTPFEAPHLSEQGREYDTLVKVDGTWLISKRVVIADSGIPEMYRETYLPRRDYDITAE